MDMLSGENVVCGTMSKELHEQYVCVAVAMSKAYNFGRQVMSPISLKRSEEERECSIACEYGTCGYNNNDNIAIAIAIQNMRPCAEPAASSQHPIRITGKTTAPFNKMTIILMNIMY